MVNLRALLRSRLTEDVFLAVREKHGVEFSVLVCDDSTTKLVSSCFRVHEVNDLGVGTVLNIGYEREQLPNTPAIYLIRPTKENILRLIQDFEGKQRTYRRAFLFTTGPLEEALFEKLAESAAADYLGEFIELRLDFVAFESRVALLGRTGAISTLYLPRTERDKLVEMERSVEQLVSLCLALKEYPYVRFQEAGNAISRSIAENFEALMQRSIRNLKDFQYCENRATLLIVDRSLDPVAPLMHEYSYQAMINDLLPCEGEMVNLKQQPSNGEESGPLVLSNEEELWDSLRHQHISEVTKAVISQLDDFRKQNAIAKSKGNQDTKDLLAMAKALPQYREEMRKFSKHMKLAEACFDAFDSQKLREISSLEQDMATGVDENGKKTSRTELQHRLVGFIQDDQIQLSDKLRLLMIYIITQDGIESNTRKQLFNAGKFSEAHEESILNLSQLGITLQNSSKKASARKMDKDKLAKAKERALSVPLELMRFVPLLYEIIEDQLDGKLSTGFKWVKEPISQSFFPKVSSKVKSVRESRRKKEKKADEKKMEEYPGPKLIVFVAGGVTFSEMRSIYELAALKSREVILVSSQTLTARQFIKELNATHSL